MTVGALSCNHWFFETIKTFGNAMALQINEVFAKHGLNAWLLRMSKMRGLIS
jgi:hypothetical protein